jgi:hypothetical protein
MSEPGTSSYRSLDPAKIVTTAATLRERIGALFPGSGLWRVAGELLATCEDAAALSAWLARPNRWLRLAGGAGVAALLAALGGALLRLKVQLGFSTFSDAVQGLEATVNNIVFLGIAVFFLLGWESRYKRRRALAALHALRSMAHIIDMHQLTKDPAWLLRGGEGAGRGGEAARGEGGESRGAAGRGEGVAEAAGAARAKRAMDAHQLTRYLDLCSDLLSVISKVAALYVQRFQDPVTLAAVDEVESLASGLSRKIWQKIVLLERTR